MDAVKAWRVPSTARAIAALGWKHLVKVWILQVPHIEQYLSKPHLKKNGVHE